MNPIQKPQSHQHTDEANNPYRFIILRDHLLHRLTPHSRQQKRHQSFENQYQSNRNQQRMRAHLIFFLLLPQLDRYPGSI